MVTVTSVELQKRFGPVRERALREPVIVTHHGRPSLVVLSADEFARLTALDTRRRHRPWDQPPDIAEALEQAAPAAATAGFAGEEEG